MPDGTGLCRCLDKCLAVSKPVCGSDGQTYKDECEIMRASCIKRQPITTAKHGKCRTYSSIYLSNCKRARNWLS